MTGSSGTELVRLLTDLDYLDLSSVETIVLGQDQIVQLNKAFEDGVQRGLQTGLQVYASVAGQPVLSLGLGESSPGRPMTDDVIMPWRSAGKPVTALLILKRIEEGRLRLNTRLEEILPESSTTDKAELTVFDLLTHQSGFPQTDTGWPQVDWRESVRRSLETPRQLPIGSAAYHPQGSWFLLGEILRRLEPMDSSSDFNSVLQSDLLGPLQMTNVWCGIPESELASVAGRIPQLHERVAGRLQPSSYSSAPWITTASPGGNLRGPVRQLGRFLEVLLRRGKLENGVAFVSASTVEQMTSIHREGQYDQTLQHIIDFGLGAIRDSKRHGPETVPYGYGRYCSSSSFGHGGSQCSIGFVDPERELVVAWAANAFCGEPQHQRRNRMINDAIYEDLGLV